MTVNPIKLECKVDGCEERGMSGKKKSQNKGEESRREKGSLRNRANFLDFLIDCDVLGDGCHDRGTG